MVVESVSQDKMLMFLPHTRSKRQWLSFIILLLSETALYIYNFPNIDYMFFSTTRSALDNQSYNNDVITHVTHIDDPEEFNELRIRYDIFTNNLSFFSFSTTKKCLTKIIIRLL